MPSEKVVIMRDSGLKFCEACHEEEVKQFINKERVEDAVKEARLRKKDGHTGKFIYAANYYEDLTEEERAAVKKIMKEEN